MATRSLNKVMLIGNLTRDPELRYTPAGTAVCTFGLATNRTWTTQAGETKEDVEFHRIVSWNKLAELCAQLLAKGRKVYVEGRLSTHTWSSSDGVQHTTTEIVIEDMIILDSKRVIKEGTAMEVEKEAVVPPSSQTSSSIASPPTPSATGDDTAAVTKKKSAKREAKAQEKAENPAENITPDDIPF